MECVLSMFVFRKESHRFSRHFSNCEVDHDLFVAVRMLFPPKPQQERRHRVLGRNESSAIGVHESDQAPRRCRSVPAR
jgi:hypothetical protein